MCVLLHSQVSPQCVSHAEVPPHAIKGSDAVKRVTCQQCSSDGLVIVESSRSILVDEQASASEQRTTRSERTKRTNKRTHARTKSTTSERANEANEPRNQRTTNEAFEVTPSRVMANGHQQTTTTYLWTRWWWWWWWLLLVVVGRRRRRRGMGVWRSRWRWLASWNVAVGSWEVRTAVAF
mgnify:CR=1 FL=1